MNLSRYWIPAFAGMTLAFAATAADSLLPRKAQFLPVDEAFEVQPLEVRDGHLEVSWRIAREYYLYRDRFTFTLKEPAGASLGAAALPASLPYEDEHFGTVQVYRDKVTARLPLKAPAGAPVKVTVVYQGCADAGLCYPPQTRTLELMR